MIAFACAVAGVGLRSAMANSLAITANRNRPQLGWRRSAVMAVVNLHAALHFGLLVRLMDVPKQGLAVLLIAGQHEEVLPIPAVGQADDDVAERVVRCGVLHSRRPTVVAADSMAAARIRHLYG